MAHIVARASLCCGENLIKTALACILCSRNALLPSQLKRMLNLWLSATSARANPRTVAFFNSDEDLMPEEDLTLHPGLTTMALNILLSQLQPLLIGFDSIDVSGRGLEASVANQHQQAVETLESDEWKDFYLKTSSGLQLCSIEVAKVVRRLCFSTGRPISRFSASRRLGYTAHPRGASEPPPLSSTPTEMQTYRILLCINFENLKDKVYYAVSRYLFKLTFS